MQAQQQDIQVVTPDASLPGVLTVPEGSKGLVVFAHGSGSSRHSPRNQSVAETLNDGGLATLLFDLLTAEEHQVDAKTRAHRFDMDLLNRRLTGAVDFLQQEPHLAELSLGLFGASTGAAAALMTAAARPEAISAVVSRGGRPDLAGEALARVRAPTLLIVGGNDPQVIDLNKQAAESLTSPKQLEIVSGATHLFEEAGKLEEVARLALQWFTDKFPTTQ